MRLGILGIGKMGTAVARRLSAQGHDLSLWNRTRSKAEGADLGRVLGPAAVVERCRRQAS